MKKYNSLDIFCFLKKKHLSRDASKGNSYITNTFYDIAVGAVHKPYLVTLRTIK